MEVRLKVLVGTSAGQELKLPAPKFLIGRSEDCHLRPKSDLISRHHCVLLLENDTLVVRDLGSRNGTFVNEERVAPERELQSGDRLKVGPLEFEVKLVASTGSKKLPRVTSVKEAASRTATGSQTDDVDVSQWLTSPGLDSAPPEPDDVPDEAAETREIEAADTEEINLRATCIMPPNSSAAPGPSKPAGKTPTKPASADSGKAAADVLRKFFQRR